MVMAEGRRSPGALGAPAWSAAQHLRGARGVREGREQPVYHNSERRLLFESSARVFFPLLFERERNISVSETRRLAASSARDRACNQPRYVRWAGLEPGALQAVGQRSNHGAHRPGHNSVRLKQNT